MKRRNFCLGAVLVLTAAPLRAGAAPIQATLYKDPQCGCCEGYATYLRQKGLRRRSKAHQRPCRNQSQGWCAIGIARLSHHVRGRLRHRWSRTDKDYSEAVVRAAGHRRDHASRHANRVARHDRSKDRAVQNLRRPQGWEAIDRLRHRMINSVVFSQIECSTE